MEAEQYTAIMGAIAAQSAKSDTTNDKLDAMHGDFREFKGRMDVEVEALKSEAKSQRLWSRIQTVAILPLVAALHEIASSMGLIK